MDAGSYHFILHTIILYDFPIGFFCFGSLSKRMPTNYKPTKKTMIGTSLHKTFHYFFVFGSLHVLQPTNQIKIKIKTLFIGVKINKLNFTNFHMDYKSRN